MTRLSAFPSATCYLVPTMFLSLATCHLPLPLMPLVTDFVGCAFTDRTHAKQRHVRQPRLRQNIL